MVFLKRFCVFIYFRVGKGEREGERHQYVVSSCVPPTGDLACNLGMCPRPGIEQMTLWFAGWHSTTEPHQAGQIFFSNYTGQGHSL